MSSDSSKEDVIVISASYNRENGLRGDSEFT